MEFMARHRLLVLRCRGTRGEDADPIEAWWFRRCRVCRRIGCEATVIPLRFYSEQLGPPPLPSTDPDRCPIFVPVNDTGSPDDECEYCPTGRRRDHDQRAIEGPHVDPRPWLSNSQWEEILAGQVGTQPLKAG
jgi:hypothetical protein